MFIILLLANYEELAKDRYAGTRTNISNTDAIQLEIIYIYFEILWNGYK